MSVKLSKRTLNTRVHTIPANASYIEFERSDGNSRSWPTNNVEVVDAEGQVNWMRPVAEDESVAILWRKNIGQWLAVQTGRAASSQGEEYVLKSWPDGYKLYDHNKGPRGNPRHDPYLIGSVHTKRFRSPAEFFPHALWLLTDETMNNANCQCRYCNKKPQRQITADLGLKSAKRQADSPTSTGSRKRPREVVPKPPHAGVRRAPRPAREVAPRPSGPVQFEVTAKSNDIRDALAHRDSRMIRYFREGEVVWCCIHPAIAVPGSAEDAIVYWPGLVDRHTTKSETLPRSPTIDSKTIAPSASRPSSPQPEITWTVRQRTQYSIKLLGTVHHVLLSDAEVLPYLAYVPGDHLMGLLLREFEEVLKTPLGQEVLDGESLMSDFDPLRVDWDPNTRFNRAILPFSIGMQIAAKMAHFWTPTDEWECKLVLSPPSSPPHVVSPPPAAPPAEPSMSLHSVIASAMEANAKLPTQDYDAPSASAPMPSLPAAAPPPQTITQLRYQGLWWGAERIWTDELVRLKLSRAQFAPQGTETVLPPAGPSEGSRQWNSENGLPIDSGHSGAGHKGLFMLIEGFYVVEVPNKDNPGTTSKECRACGQLFELVDEDWKEEYKEPFAALTEGTKKETPPPFDPSQPVVNLPVDDPLLQSASMSGTPASGAQSASNVAPVPPAPSASQNANGLLSHSSNSLPYPLPEPPRCYKFHPILAPGHEVVVSLTLISGRYYPHLIDHPQLSSVQQQLASDPTLSPIYKVLWSLQGMMPGVWQCMEPRTWKNGRHVMLADATTEAREELIIKRKEILQGPVDGDVVMKVHPPNPFSGVPVGMAVEPARSGGPSPDVPSSSTSAV